MVVFFVSRCSRIHATRGKKRIHGHAYMEEIVPQPARSLFCTDPPACRKWRINNGKMFSLGFSDCHKYIYASPSPWHKIKAGYGTLARRREVKVSPDIPQWLWLLFLLYHSYICLYHHQELLKYTARLCGITIYITHAVVFFGTINHFSAAKALHSSAKQSYSRDHYLYIHISPFMHPSVCACQPFSKYTLQHCPSRSRYAYSLFFLSQIYLTLQCFVQYAFRPMLRIPIWSLSPTTAIDGTGCMLSYAESYLLPAHPNCAGALSSPVRHL